MAYNSKFTGAQIDALLDASEAMKASKEDVANKVTSIGADATDVQYPSAKAVKDKLDELEAKMPSQDGIEHPVSVSNFSGSDLDLADENGNIILRLNKGHIQTKYFDSSNVNLFNATKLNKPHCICHGYGAATGAANTIPYFRNGIQKGYEWFEVDAVATEDNVAVCTHLYDSYTVKNIATGEKDSIQISSINYADLVANYTWTDGTPINSTKELIYYLCYIKKFPLWIDGQGLGDNHRKELSQYACDLGVGEYVFHEGNRIFPDVPISNCIASGGSVDEIKSFALTYKKGNNNIIFNIGNSLTAEQVKELADAAHSVSCYISSWTFGDVDKIRMYMNNGADFIITSGIVNNQI